MTDHYAILIEWSDEDQTYVVTLPEWAERVYQPVTDGATYEEAARKGAAVLATLVEQAGLYGESLPEPRVYSPAGAGRKGPL